ncbi:unnamed protein product [Effrenium voratum]|nr:unnamed protein product [Effrenium voratum]
MLFQARGRQRGAPGEKQRTHETGDRCTSSSPCLCMDGPCTTCTVRTPMNFVRSRCVPCDYGTLSVQHGFLNVKNILTKGSGSSPCQSCTELSMDVDSLIACGEGRIDVPPGVMVTAGIRGWFAKFRKASRWKSLSKARAWRCPYRAACPGHRVSKMGVLGHLCERGYDERSPGCAQCAKGYGRKVSDPFVCTKCPARWAIWLFLVGKQVLLFAIGMVSAHRAAAGRGRVGVIFKIMISFGTASACIFQAVSPLDAFRSNVGSLRRLIGLGGQVSSWTGLYNVGYECLFGQRRLSVDSFLMLGVLPPILLLSVSMVFNAVAAFLGREDLAQTWVLRSTLVIGNMYMATASSAFTKPLSCFRMQLGPKAATLCSFTHGPCRPWRDKVLAVMGLSLITLAVPVYWVKLLKLSKRWERVTRRRAMGFLIAGYRPEFEWWEAVVVVRKALLLQVRTFFPPSYAPMTNIMLILLILGASLALHLVVWPYEDTELNRIEGAALSASCAALLMASLAIAPEWNKETSL